MSYPREESTCWPPSCRLHEHTEDEVRDAVKAAERRRDRSGGGKPKSASADAKKEEEPWIVFWMDPKCATSGPCRCCGYFYGPGNKEKVGQKVVWR